MVLPALRQRDYMVLRYFCLTASGKQTFPAIGSNYSLPLAENNFTFNSGFKSPRTGYHF